MKTFRPVGNDSTTICDRCGKQVDHNTGAEDEENLTGYFLVPKKNIIFESHVCNEPDLCTECVESLNNWFDSEKYKEVESKWLIEDDLPIMDLAIKNMADQIIFHQREYNELELEGGGYVEESREITVTRYIELAAKELREAFVLSEKELNDGK